MQNISYTCLKQYTKQMNWNNNAYMLDYNRNQLEK